MSPKLKLAGVALSGGGAVVDLTLDSRMSLSVFGPAASGKSAFLNVCAGTERPSRGSVQRHGKVALAGFDSFARKATPLAIAQEAAGKSAQHAAEALGALGLWEDRKKPVQNLTAGQFMACQLIGPLASNGELILIDCHLDLLDPWAYRETVALLQKRVSRGALLVLATNNPLWAEQTDYLVVLQSKKIAFSGTYAELEGQTPAAEVQVETRDAEGARALCEPLDIQLSETDGKLLFKTQKGQALAARMLLEGYGDVRMTTLQRPSARQLLEALIR